MAARVGGGVCVWRVRGGVCVVACACGCRACVCVKYVFVVITDIVGMYSGTWMLGGSGGGEVGKLTAWNYKGRLARKLTKFL